MASLLLCTLLLSVIIITDVLLNVIVVTACSTST
jgi:hypothetical protein